MLIPGGWHGGWTFAGFVARLQQAGHEAYAPTLTGLDPVPGAERGNVNLETHIEDVLGLLAVEDLTRVILCAHSYGGMVATGVADRASERIAALVYLDAFVPEDGQSWWDLAGDGYRSIAIERARGDGFGVVPPDHLDSRCAPHPLASFVQALRLTGRERTIARRVFVYASGWSATPFTEQYLRLREDPGWTVRTLACRHDLINAAPDAVMEILAEVAGEVPLA